jgi:sigma-B regulation protein RsbU (phosphoserine phosphatase)
MADAGLALLREQLVERRNQLVDVMRQPDAATRLRSLLVEVDAALDRMRLGTFGLCETCHDPIEPDRLLADPLVRLCLDHLTPSQQTRLERDLELAVRIQQGLLPRQPFQAGSWEMAYEYRPAHLVSGDYCDALPGQNGDWHFLLGDVAGKGVAASMLMTQLHAMFRALVPLGLSLPQLVARASTIFCESTLPTHYATLVILRAQANGAVEVCSAGHLPAVLVHDGRASRIEAGGLPVGMFCGADYATTVVTMTPGDTLALYTDGLSETENEAGEEFGLDRIADSCAAHAGMRPDSVVSDCLAAVDRFRSGPVADDVTMMVISRQHM